MKISTIGAYGFTEEAFFHTLQVAGVDCFVDIRWRRGMRGAEYAFANATRLQHRLEQFGITYHPFRALAPPPHIRQTQSLADKQQKIAKRQRSVLSPEFIAAYREILAPFDPLEFLAGLPREPQHLVFFCVERDPAACHRLLVAEKFGRMLSLPIEHLMP